MELTSKLEIEKQFHDYKAVTGISEKDRFYNWGGIREADEFLFSLLNNLSNKTVLELGCGTGHNAVELAKRGAYVYAIDISEESIKKAIELATKEQLIDKIFFQAIAVEEMDFPDEKFDLVFGHAILHHLELPIAIKKIYRLLKKNGKAVFLEPLRHNPFIQLFRKFTPNRRTPTEKPLSIKDIDSLAQLFSKKKERMFYLFSPLSAFWSNVIPNRKLFNLTKKTLFTLEEFMIRCNKFLRRFCWIVVMQLTK